MAFAKSTKFTRLCEVCQSYVMPKYLVFNHYSFHIERYCSFPLALKCIDWSIIGLCKRYFLSSVRRLGPRESRAPKEGGFTPRAEEKGVRGVKNLGPIAIGAYELQLSISNMAQIQISARFMIKRGPSNFSNCYNVLKIKKRQLGIIS